MLRDEIKVRHGGRLKESKVERTEKKPSSPNDKMDRENKQMGGNLPAKGEVNSRDSGREGPQY